MNITYQEKLYYKTKVVIDSLYSKNTMYTCTIIKVKHTSCSLSWNKKDQGQSVMTEVWWLFFGRDISVMGHWSMLMSSLEPHWHVSFERSQYVFVEYEQIFPKNKHQSLQSCLHF